jgi:GntR family transcriptional regulator
MIHNGDKPIFLQLAEVIKNRILDNTLSFDDRIPSVRDLAAEFEVNNNTSMHAIEKLALENIVYQKRGLGYFVTKDAKQIIEQQRRQQFTESFLPILKKAMTDLNISKEELMDML